MFSIFKKRLFLKDQLEGLVDIHNHILPGIDDGAATVEESISLIRRFSDMGVKSFIATPHVMNDYYPNTPDSINTALQKLQQALKNSGMASDVRIRAAAEYMMDHSFLEILEKETLLTLKDNLVLVEMSYFQAPLNLKEILFQVQTRGYKPLLAHPERYAFYHSKKSLSNYEDLKSRGCLFQLNILSLTGHYGRYIEETALKLLDNNMIDFIGTDTHQMRHLDKLSAARLPQKRIAQIRPILQKTREVFGASFS